jgi:hypothetical protein
MLQAVTLSEAKGPKPFDLAKVVAFTSVRLLRCAQDDND